MGKNLWRSPVQPPAQSRRSSYIRCLRAFFSPTQNTSSSGGHTTLPGPALVFYHPYGEKKNSPHILIRISRLATCVRCLSAWRCAPPQRVWLHFLEATGRSERSPENADHQITKSRFKYSSFKYSRTKRSGRSLLVS